MLPVVENVLGAIIVAGLLYTAFALLRVRAFAMKPRVAGAALVPITILKPICGLEVELYENLCSFCEQEYPSFQIVFCLHDRDDPALAVVQRAIDAHPECDFALAIGATTTARNPKVANLASGLAVAKYDLLVVADADIRVESDYLREVAAAFVAEGVGAATCLYGGSARGGIASRLGAMHVNDHFAPSVLVATALEPLRFCLGATMAVRRTVLQEIGGFGALADHLGDDYVLGALVAARGYQIALLPSAVCSIVSEPGLAALFAHQLRWARTIRAQRPLGYAMLFVTYPLPFAAIDLIVANGALPVLALFAVTLGLRAALHVVARDGFSPRERGAAWLIPICDALDLTVWLVAYLGRSVTWKARRYNVRTDGQLGCDFAHKGSPPAKR